LKNKGAPVKIPDRDAKMRILVEKYGPWCPIALTRSNERREKVTDLHHQHIHKTKPITMVIIPIGVLTQIALQLEDIAAEIEK
jgi:hypothetical protein